MNRVAVIMSVYKNDKLSFLKESVESILDQTFTNFTFFIKIDGPVSNEINDYLSCLSDSRIDVYRRENNKGLAHSLNELIENCLNKGFEYLVRMDADDISVPHRIQRTLLEFNNNPNLKMIGSNCTEIDENGKFLFLKKMPETAEEIKKMMYYRCPFIHPTITFHRDFFLNVGVYDPKFTLIEDLDLWSRAIINNIQMKNINEPLLKFRISSDYWKRRSSWDKIFKELKISYYFMKKTKTYYKFHKLILGKFLVRFILKIMPAFVNQYLYNKLR